MYDMVRHIFTYTHIADYERTYLHFLVAEEDKKLLFQQTYERILFTLLAF